MLHIMPSNALWIMKFLYLYSICSFVGFFRLLIGPRIYHQTAMNVIDSLQYPQLNK